MPPATAPAAEITQGYTLLRAGQAAQADQLARRLLEATPQAIEALVLASEARLALDDPSGALEMNARAIAEAGTSALPLLVKQATLQMQARRKRDALASVAQALPLAAGDAQALAALARIQTGCNAPADARDSFAAALACPHAPAQRPALLFGLAASAFFLGDTVQAETCLDELLRLQPQAGHAAWLRASLRRQTQGRDHVEALRTMLATPFRHPAEHAAAGYALAKELEDLERHDEAFQALAAAAASKRSTLRYDVDAECRAIAGMCEALGELDGPGHDEAGAIFVVGLPRTGTTLVESALIRHGGAHSAGELLDFGLLVSAQVHQHRQRHPASDAGHALRALDGAALGREYMRGAREAAAGAATFVDKMPVNFMYCGAIARALPSARIVHVTRHPLDACFAIYKTLFNQAYHFSYDLDELARYYIAYHRAMEHWRSRLPGRIIEIGYEAFTADPDGEARTLVAACGLDWRDGGDAPAAVTSASAAQVRQPVHTRSVGNWRRHAHALAPLRARLAEAGIALD